MIPIFRLNIMSVALMLAFGSAAATQAQNATKCVASDKDCPKAEQETAKPDVVKGTSRARTTSSDTAKFVSNFSGVQASYTRAEAPYRSKPAGASVDSSRAQEPADDAQALAKKLANPVASLISVPFQSNFDFGLGPNGDGFKYTLNFQPVIPISINKDWNLISRTITPIVAQHNVVGTTTQFGLSDIVQSFFISPNKSKPFIWGLGPVLLIPTGTSQYLGTQKFGLGPTVLVMNQQGPWSYGVLMNHIWSVAGKSTRADVNSTFLQPFISYTTKTAWTYTFNTESTYDWTAKTWSVPVHIQVTKLVKIGKQRVSVGGAARCWTATTPSGPTGCGFRLLITPLFPKK